MLKKNDPNKEIAMYFKLMEPKCLIVILFSKKNDAYKHAH